MLAKIDDHHQIELAEALGFEIYCELDETLKLIGGKSPETLRNWVKKFNFPPPKYLGGSPAFPLRKMIQWLQDQPEARDWRAPGQKVGRRRISKPNVDAQALKEVETASA